jgi:hypothetical protein
VATSLNDLEKMAHALTAEERVAAYDRGETETYAAEDVFAEARRLSR